MNAYTGSQCKMYFFLQIKVCCLGNTDRAPSHCFLSWETETQRGSNHSCWPNSRASQWGPGLSIAPHGSRWHWQPSPFTAVGWEAPSWAHWGGTHRASLALHKRKLWCLSLPSDVSSFPTPLAETPMAVSTLVLSKPGLGKSVSNLLHTEL